MSVQHDLNLNSTIKNVDLTIENWDVSIKYLDTVVGICFRRKNLEFTVLLKFTLKSIAAIFTIKNEGLNQPIKMSYLYLQMLNHVI